MRTDLKIFIVFTFALVGLVLFTESAQASSCDTAALSAYNVTGPGSVYAIVSGVHTNGNANYVIITVYGTDGSSYVTASMNHKEGGDWDYTINPADYKTYIVEFWPSWNKCATLYFTRNAPTPTPPPGFNLTISKSGSGGGTVTSSEGKINCGGTCSATYNASDNTTLTAVPDSGSSFDGWSGDCPGNCVFNGNKTAIATFSHQPTGSVIINSNNQAATNYTSGPASWGTHGWNGSHTWTDAPPGTYSVTADPVPNYSVTVSPQSGTLSANGVLQFNVNYGPAQPTASITCSPSTVSYSAVANVSWSSTNAQSCTISPNGWTGTSGSQSTGALYSTQTYNLTCTGF